MAHMTKHELKHDEMEDIGERVSAWYNRNSTVITWILAVVLVGLIGWKGYEKFNDSRVARANSDFSTALRNYTDAVGEMSEAKRKELFTTSISQAEAVARDYSSLPIAREAQLLLANGHYYQGDMKAALEAYNTYAAGAKNSAEKAIGLLGKGNANENLEVTTKESRYGLEAQNAYKEAIKLAPGTYLAAEAKLALARFSQMHADRQEFARELYDEVIRERKPKLVAAAPGEKAIKTERGQELTTETVQRLRSFAELSYSKEAEQGRAQLRSLPTTKQ
jgi:hypothetical protein